MAGEDWMQEFTVKLVLSMLVRLQEIAIKSSCSVKEVVGQLLAHAIEMYDVAKSPEEIEKHVESFSPTLPRPVIDRERIQAMVDRHKGTQGADQ